LAHHLPWQTILFFHTLSEDSAATGIGGNQLDNSMFDSGAVYIFERSLSNDWTQQTYLKAPNTGTNDCFGISVDLLGNTLVVGAIGEASSSSNNPSDNSIIEAGAVYVYTQTGTNWTQQAYLKAPFADARDKFGASLSLSDTHLAVGAPGESSNAQGINGDQANNSAPRSGAVYVFRSIRNGWDLQAYIKAKNAGVSDFFGSTLELSNQMLLVGSEGESSSAVGIGGEPSDNSLIRSGAAYLYRISD